jgi:hypothetical protein
MKNEWAALQGDVPLRFSRKLCSYCEKETIFRGAKCLTCSQYHLMRGSGAAPKWNGTSRSMVRQKAIKQAGRDRRDAYKRAAAESRAKFEGKR